MVHCNYCACEVDVEVDDANGFSCCVQCGRVLEDTAFSADITFQKDAGGESTVMGQFVNESGVARGIGRIHGGRVYAFQADSHEKAQQRGRHDIAHLVDMLSVRPREESIESAHRLYKLALQHGFTRGRRTNQVAAAALYLVCRQDSKPFLLIDFSDALQVNVFTLGAVFLQLAKLLRLNEHPMFAKPVDPSLYIHRFADRLDFGRQMPGVANTALRLVASMKRDWIQTGRRPSGICGAAIYIAAHIHGFERSIRDVVSVVHIGEHTLSKRLYEFSSTTASAYTADEFEARVNQIDEDEKQRLEAAVPEAQPAGLLVSAGCEHLRMGEAHFAHAMCRGCYLEFMKSSGGLHNGADPPAFERSRRKEMMELLALPEPEDEEEETEIEDEEAFQREEHGIAEDMLGAFRDAQLQQFAPFLPSSAEREEEAAAAAAEEEGAGRRQRRGAAGGSKAGTPVPVGRKRRGGDAAPQHEDDGDEEEAAEAEAEAAASGAAAPAGPGSDDAAAGTQRQAGKRRKGVTTAGAAAPAAAGPSQLSDQTGAAAAAAGAGGGLAPAAAGAQAGAAGGPSQRSEQTAAAAAAADSGESEEDEGEAAAQVQAGAIVAVPQQQQQGQAPAGAAEAAAAGGSGRGGELVVAGGGGGGGGGQGGGEEGPEDDNLSDINDSDIDMYLAEPDEVQCKEEIWNMMNKDWLENQAAKRASQEVAERVAAEQAAAQEAAEAAGVQYKRGRGRPVGSKTRNHRAGMADLPPAETAQEAAMRMLDHRKLSNKINYTALADLFSEDQGGAGGSGEPAPAAGAAGGAEEEGDEEEGGRGAAVAAAIRERARQQEEEEARREAQQQAALEAERRTAGRRLRPGGLGLPHGGKLGAVGAGQPRGVGVLARRAGGLGSLRDGNFRSQLVGSSGAAASGGAAGPSSSKKSVRFAE